LRGTGPFVIKGWTPGKQLTLVARDDYWNGRAFLDSVEVELGKPVREQLIAFDVGKLDLLEISPETPFSAGDRRVERSFPMRWVGLVFARAPSGNEPGLREALGLSIDRATINNVLLRGSGELSGSLLPEWMSGYSFLFPVNRNPDRARQLSNEAKPAGASWTLNFDATDPVLRLIAERIVLNAKDAGLSLQLSNGPSADISLVRMMPWSPEPHLALENMLTRLGFPAATLEDASPSSLYAAEKAALDSQRVIPLFHLRSTVALGTTLRGWELADSGAWPLADIWLWAGTP
jgi:peptide/nickel transport system substrate-binding protein